jgi:hypothetical protein
MHLLDDDIEAWDEYREQVLKVNDKDMPQDVQFSRYEREDVTVENKMVPMIWVLKQDRAYRVK